MTEDMLERRKWLTKECTEFKIEQWSVNQHHKMIQIYNKEEN